MLREAVSAIDRWEEPDSVATQIVKQSLVARMSADHADSAVVVAHEAVPLEVVWSAGGSSWLRKRPYLLVHGL